MNFHFFFVILTEEKMKFVKIQKEKENKKVSTLKAVKSLLQRVLHGFNSLNYFDENVNNDSHDNKSLDDISASSVFQPLLPVSEISNFYNRNRGMMNENKINHERKEKCFTKENKKARKIEDRNEDRLNEGKEEGQEEEREGRVKKNGDEREEEDEDEDGDGDDDEDEDEEEVDTYKDKKIIESVLYDLFNKNKKNTSYTISNETIVDDVFSVALDFILNNNVFQEQNNIRGENEREREARPEIKTEILSYQIVIKLIFGLFSRNVSNEIILLEEIIGKKEENFSELFSYFLQKSLLFEKNILSLILMEREHSFSINEENTIERNFFSLVELFLLNSSNNGITDPKFFMKNNHKIIQVLEYYSLKCNMIHDVYQRSQHEIENIKNIQKKYNIAMKQIDKLDNECNEIEYDINNPVYSYDENIKDNNRNHYLSLLYDIDIKYDIKNINIKLKQWEIITIICEKELNTLWGQIIELGIKVPGLLDGAVDNISKAGVCRIFDFDRYYKCHINLS